MKRVKGLGEWVGLAGKMVTLYKVLGVILPALWLMLLGLWKVLLPYLSRLLLGL